ncbi:hypothetical protein [Pseudarthrobacter sp. PS3-L1]|uniref:hypothetical protein n=1 Tax=Pseudarthrobacter sp. PS3-L1 TaxID=3046207 RepID=UPI0024BA0053|nr:hypothetical protein [Pseudarthrobacter sp. PS3-L1]MDJ0321676.1 hypothetical protein [Pseudarthrobacter sp. PS3-L1]
MDLMETTRLIIWVNQFDPFVQANDAAADIWQHSMGPISYAEAEESVVAHYRLNPGQQAQPGGILKRALNNRASKEAGQRAIEVPQTRRELEQGDGKLMRYWRQRNPDEWVRLMEQGKQDRRDDLDKRGLA